MSVYDFIQRYYISPIVYDSGYNPVNTLTWAIILGLVVFAILKLLQRLSIPIDDEFIITVFPYILVGATLRVLEDAEVLGPPVSYLLITPLIHIIVFIAFMAATITVMTLLGRDVVSGYHRPMRVFGYGWTLLNLVILTTSISLKMPWVLASIIGLALLISGVVYTIAHKLGWGFITGNLNMSLLGAHIFDASSTFVGVDFLGYVEKHVVPTLLINLTGTAGVMYPLKLAIFIPILFILDTGFDDDPELRSLTKLAILTLGLAPGLRNTLRMSFGI